MTPLNNNDVFQITMESLWFNWGIKEAIDYPRLHHQLFPTTTQVDANFPQVKESYFNLLF